MKVKKATDKKPTTKVTGKTKAVKQASKSSNKYSADTFMGGKKASGEHMRVPQPDTLNMKVSKAYQDDHHSEPFSFLRPLQNDKKGKQFIKFEVFDNFLKSDMIDDVKNSMNSCVNATGCTISNAVDTASVASNMVEEVLGKVSKSLSDATHQNMRLGQELLRCRDARDMISFNQKMFETNFHNMVNLYLDVSCTVQCFVTKHVGLSSGYLDKNIKCFTSK